MKTIPRIISLSIFSLFFFACNFNNNKEQPTETKPDSISKPTNNKEEVWTIERCYKENPYYFDTLLKNGYALHFEYYKRDINSAINSQLTLVKGNKTIDTLTTMGYGVIMKNLGYIGADFNDYFAFVQSYVSGNPHEMQLLKKSDATKIVEGFIVDADEKNELLLYCKGYDSLMLYDIKRKTDKLLVNLKNCDYITSSVSQLGDVLKIKKVTSANIEIEILQNDTKKIRKKYSR